MVEYRIEDDLDVGTTDWAEVPKRANFGLSTETAEAVAEHEDNDSGGDWFAAMDVIMTLRLRSRGRTHLYRIKAEAVMRYNAEEVP